MHYLSRLALCFLLVASTTAHIFSNDIHSKNQDRLHDVSRSKKEVRRVNSRGERELMGELWRSDLPWSELASNLSLKALLLDTSPANFLAECTPEFEKPPTSDDGDRTNYALINQPSGLCVNHISCAFESCFPDPSNPTLNASLFSLQYPTADFLYSNLPPSYKSLITNTSNPRYNLPSKVLFPTVASDVIAAVKFAKKYGLELSVKNSGHNYAGASTKKNTLHINMNRYTRYADADIGFYECSVGSSNSTSFKEDLSDQPCRLAFARNKPAMMRIGGGENWGKC